MSDPTEGRLSEEELRAIELLPTVLRHDLGCVHFHRPGHCSCGRDTMIAAVGHARRLAAAEPPPTPPERQLREALARVEQSADDVAEVLTQVGLARVHRDHSVRVPTAGAYALTRLLAAARDGAALTAPPPTLGAPEAGGIVWVVAAQYPDDSTSVSRNVYRSDEDAKASCPPQIKWTKTTYGTWYGRYAQVSYSIAPHTILPAPLTPEDPPEEKTDGE